MDISRLKAHLLDPDDVEYVWDKVEPILARVVSRSEGELETEDILDLVTEGRMQLWIVAEDKEIIAALVTQIITYPQKKVLRLGSLAGEDFNKFKHFNKLRKNDHFTPPANTIFYQVHQNIHF